MVGVRNAEKNRVDKLLEDTCLKLSVVASDIFGGSGRAMMAALIAGERDPKALAELARTRLRTKIPRLEEAFAGLRLATFDDHHRFLLARMLARVDAVDLDITAVDTQIGSTWPLSLTRPPGSMRSPALGRPRPRSSSPRSGST